MNKIVKLGFTLLILSLGLISCSESKKKDHSKDLEVSEEKIELKEDVQVKDHGYETAMAAYQCPMKCEGDKSYEEEGSCPVCKMDLKRVETDHEESDTGKSEAEEESSE